MIERGKETVTIICDKCKRESFAALDNYNEVFREEGWALNKGRKFMHLCRGCLPKKSREAMDFVKKVLG